MNFTGIVAIAKNSAIGKGGKLPWHYSSDLKFFKQTTSGNTVIMGRKTFASVGKPLPNRLNLVLSRSEKHENRPNLLFFKTKAEILALSNFLKSEIFIIGGAAIYTEFAAEISKWIVTEIPQTIENADAFMPPDFLANFEIKQEIELEPQLKVKIYERRNTAS